VDERERELLTKIVQQQLQRAQQRMKSQADKHRMEREFQQGDLVYMKLQPYVQSTVAARSNKKLSFRYYGPYKVLQRVGKVAYKLELPEGSRIHPVIHVSQLKKHVTKESSVSDDLTTVSIDPFQIQQPLKILQTRVIQRGSKLIKQVLVQWSSMTEEMATWEDEADVPRDQAHVATG
jgi:ribosomal protein L21E